MRMSMFTCELCDKLFDGDYVECYVWGFDLVCGDCFYDHTPETWEDWKVSVCAPIAQHKWMITHNDYDGAPIHAFEGPADSRCFTGPTVADVWEQAKEYED